MTRNKEPLIDSVLNQEIQDYLLRLRIQSSDLMGDLIVKTSCDNYSIEIFLNNKNLTGIVHWDKSSKCQLKIFDLDKLVLCEEHSFFEQEALFFVCHRMLQILYNTILNAIGDKTFEVTHTLIARVLGFLVVPCLLSIGLWLFSSIFTNDNLRSSVPGIFAVLFLSLPVIYMSLHALMTLPYMFTKIKVSKNGLQLTTINCIKEYSWEEIKKVRHVASVQVLHFYHTNGKKILSVTEQLRVKKYNGQVLLKRCYEGFEMLSQSLKLYSDVKISKTLGGFSSFFFIRHE